MKGQVTFPVAVGAGFFALNLSGAVPKLDKAFAFAVTAGSGR